MKRVAPGEISRSKRNPPGPGVNGDAREREPSGVFHNPLRAKSYGRSDATARALWFEVVQTGYGRNRDGCTRSSNATASNSLTLR